MQLVASIVAAIVGKALQWLSARHDLKESVRLKLKVQTEAYAKEGYKHKAENPVDLTSDPTGDFRVRNKRKPK